MNLPCQLNFFYDLISCILLCQWRQRCLAPYVHMPLLQMLPGVTTWNYHFCGFAVHSGLASTDGTVKMECKKVNTLVFKSIYKPCCQLWFPTIELWLLCVNSAWKHIYLNWTLTFLPQMCYSNHNLLWHSIASQFPRHFHHLCGLVPLSKLLILDKTTNWYQVNKYMSYW